MNDNDLVSFPLPAHMTPKTEGLKAEATPVLNNIDSGNIGPATSALLTAAKTLGQEMEAKGGATFPGVRDSDKDRMRELSGFVWNGKVAHYYVEGAACDAFWAARNNRERMKRNAAR